MVALYRVYLNVHCTDLIHASSSDQTSANKTTATGVLISDVRDADRTRDGTDARHTRRREARPYLHVQLVTSLRDLLFCGQSVVQLLHRLLQLIERKRKTFHTNLIVHLSFVTSSITALH